MMSESDKIRLHSNQPAPHAPPRLILASASPRRKQLLERAGFVLDVQPTDIDESHRAGETVSDYVRRLAVEKARAAAQGVEWTGQLALVAADTSVWINACEPLGKPSCEDEAAEMLSRLSGREHFVTTAFCVISAEDLTSDLAEVCTTTVQMRTLDDVTIRSYIASGEPFGKAGSYAIQGLASTFVRTIDGSWDNVVGLPVGEVIAVLRAAGIIEGYPWARSK